jgi:hypothetical protein
VGRDYASVPTTAMAMAMAMATNYTLKYDNLGYYDQ